MAFHDILYFSNVDRTKLCGWIQIKLTEVTDSYQSN